MANYQFNRAAKASVRITTTVQAHSVQDAWYWLRSLDKDGSLDTREEIQDIDNNDLEDWSMFAIDGAPVFEPEIKLAAGQVWESESDGGGCAWSCTIQDVDDEGTVHFTVGSNSHRKTLHVADVHLVLDNHAAVLVDEACWLDEPKLAVGQVWRGRSVTNDPFHIKIEAIDRNEARWFDYIDASGVISTTGELRKLIGNTNAKLEPSFFKAAPAETQLAPDEEGPAQLEPEEAKIIGGLLAQPDYTSLTPRQVWEGVESDGVTPWGLTIVRVSQINGDTWVDYVRHIGGGTGSATAGLLARDLAFFKCRQVDPWQREKPETHRFVFAQKYTAKMEQYVVVHAIDKGTAIARLKKGYDEGDLDAEEQTVDIVDRHEWKLVEIDRTSLNEFVDLDA